MNNEKNVSLPLQVWCVDNTYSGEKSNKSISCTELLKPIKCFILSRKADNSTGDVLDSWKAQMGTSIHSGIASAWASRYKENLKKLGFTDKYINAIKINPETVEKGDIPVYIENRISKELLGWTITGQYDMIMDGQLIDFKSTSTFTYETKNKDKDYIYQGSIYKWLEDKKITEDTIAINFIFTDWKESKVNTTPGYPNSPLLEYKLPLIEKTQITTFILDKLTRLNDALSSGNIPDCTKEEMQWTESTFAYYSGSTTGRATKVFTTMHDALKHKVDKGKGTVIERLGKPRRCMYCAGKDLCNQYQELKEKGIV